MKNENRKDIRYPGSVSEFEIQAYLYNELKNLSHDVRGEVFSFNRRNKFDLVVFKKFQPQRIIEVKKDKIQKYKHQQLRYALHCIPVDAVRGMKEAKKYVAKFNKKCVSDRIYRINASKVKMTKEGQKCRKCGNPVIKRDCTSPVKEGQKFYYEWTLYCEKCKTMYLVEDARVEIKDVGGCCIQLSDKEGLHNGKPRLI